MRTRKYRDKLKEKKRERVRIYYSVVRAKMANVVHSMCVRLNIEDEKFNAIELHRAMNEYKKKKTVNI